MVDKTQMDTTEPVDSAPSPTFDSPTGIAETGIDAFNDIMEKHDPAAGLRDLVDGGGKELAATAQAEGVALAEQAQPAVGGKDRDRALAALKRAKTPQATIDSLDDQGLTTWGLELAADQAEVDRRLSQPQERAAEESNEQTEESGSPEQPTSAPAQPSADLIEMLAPLEEYLDSDGTEVLASVIQKMTAGQSTELNQLRDMVTTMQVDQTLRESEAMWPQLADAAVKEAARGKMGMLASTGEYTDLGALTDAAMQLLGHHQADDGTASRTLERDRLRDGGSPTVSRSQHGARPMSDDQRNRAKFSEIMERHG
ncbi:MAG: hypothetical protein OSB57_04175 [Planctomycetota bacterium]|nr:hypothetical protein [Planctomycetota bacterium]